MCNELQMPAGGKRPDSGGDSGLTGDTARAERARRSVAGVSLASAPGEEHQQHQQPQPQGGGPAAVPQAAGMRQVALPPSDLICIVVAKKQRIGTCSTGDMHSKSVSNAQLMAEVVRL